MLEGAVLWQGELRLVSQWAQLLSIHKFNQYFSEWCVVYLLNVGLPGLSKWVWPNPTQNEVFSSLSFWASLWNGLEIPCPLQLQGVDGDEDIWESYINQWYQNTWLLLWCVSFCGSSRFLWQGILIAACSRERERERERDSPGFSSQRLLHLCIIQLGVERRWWNIFQQISIKFSIPQDFSIERF